MTLWQMLQCMIKVTLTNRGSSLLIVRVVEEMRQFIIYECLTLLIVFTSAHYTGACFYVSNDPVMLILAMDNAIWFYRRSRNFLLVLVRLVTLPCRAWLRSLGLMFLRSWTMGITWYHTYYCIYIHSLYVKYVLPAIFIQDDVLRAIKYWLMELKLMFITKSKHSL